MVCTSNQIETDYCEGPPKIVNFVRVDNTEWENMSPIFNNSQNIFTKVTLVKSARTNCTIFIVLINDFGASLFLMNFSLKQQQEHMSFYKKM